jgi:polar amino acid transport system substrate-binding protein/arginine/ornithine transport system substrate-binding protein
MKRILGAAASAVVLLAASPTLALNICVEGAYPPFSETADDGSIVGFDVDIANALCAEMGEECTMVQVDWDGIIPALLEKKCDAIVASMSVTPERQEVISFTDKYYQTPAMFIAPKGTDMVDTAEGMAGKRIGVQRGSVHHGYVQDKFPDSELVLYGSQDEADLDLMAGRIDATIADSVALDFGFLRTGQGADYAFFGSPHVDPAYHGTGAGIGVRKEDTELIERFNAAIDAIRADGTYDEVAGQYFDFDVYGD